MPNRRRSNRESSSLIASYPDVAGERLHLYRRLGVFVLLLALPIAAQLPAPPRPSPGQIQFNPATADPNNTGNFDPRIEARRLAMLNALRQKSKKTDADKLLQLATELNDDAAGGGNTLTPAERIRKAAEIEKLAKNVKAKMTYVEGNPPDPTGFTVIQH